MFHSIFAISPTILTFYITWAALAAAGPGPKHTTAIYRPHSDQLGRQPRVRTGILQLELLELALEIGRQQPKIYLSKHRRPILHDIAQRLIPEWAACLIMCVGGAV
jgi:hypothetical protein